MTDPQREPFYILLKQKREQQNIELNEIAERTKINPKFIKSFEDGEFEILPLVYTRLFLRSYAIEIGADSKKVLENFEIHTTGSVQQKNDQTIIAEEPEEKAEEEETIFEPEFFTQLDQKKLLAIIAAFAVLFILASWVRNLSQSTLENGIESHKSSLSSQSANIDELKSSAMPAEFLTNTIKLDEKTINLGIKSPFYLEVLSQSDSQINLKIVENGVTTLERISSLPSGRKRSWESTGKLQFELASVKGINITLNNNEHLISQFLKPDNISEEDLAIRVILEEDGNLTAVYYTAN